MTSVSVVRCITRTRQTSAVPPDTVHPKALSFCSLWCLGQSLTPADYEKDSACNQEHEPHDSPRPEACALFRDSIGADRKSTRLNSSHSQISYAVFCLKKKKKYKKIYN